MHVRDQIAINLNSVRLEVGQQLQPGKTGTKVIDRHADTRAFNCLTESVNSSKREMASLSVNSTTICSGTNRLLQSR